MGVLLAVVTLLSVQISLVSDGLLITSILAGYDDGDFCISLISRLQFKTSVYALILGSSLTLEF